MSSRLIQLLARNRHVQGRRCEVRASSDADEAEVLLYDTIVDSQTEAEWWGGVAPEPFVKALRGIDAATIHLRINSPGGSVFGARAMETALREHRARVVVHVDGLAASAASFLAMAGDEIVMSQGAMMMIHKAWTWAWGNADDLAKTAEILTKIDGTLVQTYAARSKLSADEVAAAMAAETWYTSEEAVAAGLADSVAEVPAKAAAAWDLSAYARAPQILAPAPAPASSPAPAPAPAAATADHRHRHQQRLRAALLSAPMV